MSVYFITCRELGRVKIGYSRSPDSRFVKVQSDSPTTLALERVCEGGKDAEQALHDMFAGARIRGEWFEITPEIEHHMASLPRPEQVERGLSMTQMIVRATGCSPTYAYQMLSPKRPHQITIPVALSVFRRFGERIGPLLEATEEEIDVLEKFLGCLDLRGAK